MEPETSLGSLRDAEVVARRARVVLRPLTSALIDLEDVGRVIVFGGALRDLCEVTPSRFFRDVDLVVDGDPAEVAAVCERLGGKRNRFGGYRLSVQGRLLDVWALSRTWAIVEGLVPLSGIESLLQTTYFSTDSIAYSTNCGRVYAAPDYFEKRRRREVELVLAQNPHPTGALLRTLKLLFAQRAALSWTLARQTEELLAEHWAYLTSNGRNALRELGASAVLESVRDKLAEYLSGNERTIPFSLAERRFEPSQSLLPLSPDQ